MKALKRMVMKVKFWRNNLPLRNLFYKRSVINQKTFTDEIFRRIVKRMSGSSFYNCTFYNCVFDFGTYANAEFINCKFTDCSFVETYNLECNFKKSVFVRCDFYNASMCEVCMADCIIDTCLMIGTDLQDSDLRRCNIKNTDFGFANVSGCIFSGTAFMDGNSMKNTVSNEKTLGLFSNIEPGLNDISTVMGYIPVVDANTKELYIVTGMPGKFIHTTSNYFMCESFTTIGIESVDTGKRLLKIKDTERPYEYRLDNVTREKHFCNGESGPGIKFFITSEQAIRSVINPQFLINSYQFGMAKHNYYLRIVSKEEFGEDINLDELIPGYPEIVKEVEKYEAEFNIPTVNPPKIESLEDYDFPEPDDLDLDKVLEEEIKNGSGSN